MHLLNFLDAAAHDCLSRAHVHTLPGWTTNLPPAQEDLRVECQALETSLSKRRLDDEQWRIVGMLKYLHAFACFFSSMMCVSVMSLGEEQKDSKRRKKIRK